MIAWPSAAEGRGPAGTRCGDPGAARGGTEKAEGGPVMERRTFLVMVSGSLLDIQVLLLRG